MATTRKAKINRADHNKHGGTTAHRKLAKDEIDPSPVMHTWYPPGSAEQQDTKKPQKQKDGDRRKPTDSTPPPSQSAAGDRLKRAPKETNGEAKSGKRNKAKPSISKQETIEAPATHGETKRGRPSHDAPESTHHVGGKTTADAQTRGQSVKNGEIKHHVGGKTTANSQTGKVTADAKTVKVDTRGNSVKNEEPKHHVGDTRGKSANNEESKHQVGAQTGKVGTRGKEETKTGGTRTTKRGYWTNIETEASSNKPVHADKSRQSTKRATPPDDRVNDGGTTETKSADGKTPRKAAAMLPSSETKAAKKERFFEMDKTARPTTTNQAPRQDKTARPTTTSQAQTATSSTKPRRKPKVTVVSIDEARVPKTPRNPRNSSSTAPKKTRQGLTADQKAADQKAAGHNAANASPAVAATLLTPVKETVVNSPPLPPPKAAVADVVVASTSLAPAALPVPVKPIPPKEGASREEWKQFVLQKRAWILALNQQQQDGSTKGKT